MGMDGIGDGIAYMFWTLIIGCIIGGFALLGCGYFIYDKWFKTPTFESHKIVTPTIKLHTDGKTVDTIYVYKF